MIVTVGSKWLLSHLDDPNIIIIDGRGDMPYRFGHIKNSLPLSIDHVISTAPNGANLVIDRSLAEEVFTNFGIDDSKIVVVYGEYLDPSADKNSLDFNVSWTYKCKDIEYRVKRMAEIWITSYKTNFNPKKTAKQKCSLQVKNKSHD